MPRLSNSLVVAAYLLAIVLANLSVAYFGPASLLVNAFLFIGLDLTTRDRLHDAWSGRSLVGRMGLLILAGALISWLLNRNAGPVALASCVAFAASAVADGLAYHRLRKHPRLVRVNGSNTLGALVDSLVFPTLAFGAFEPWLVAGQFLCKVAGGALWGWILHRTCWQRSAGL